MYRIRYERREKTTLENALILIFSRFVEIAYDENFIFPEREKFVIKHPVEPPAVFDTEILITCEVKKSRIEIPGKGRIPYVAYRAVLHQKGARTEESAYAVISCDMFPKIPE